MAVENIRNLPDEIRDRLRVRAAEAGRSMEAEARIILAAACTEEPERSARDLADWVERIYAGRKPKGVVAEHGPGSARIIPIDVAVILELDRLPRRFHGDPADRVIVATSRAHAVPLATHDRRIRRSRLVELWTVPR